MRDVEANYGGLFVGATATVLAAAIGWLTARTTARHQLAAATTVARITADEAERKRLDDQTAWIVSELRKEVDRLGAVVKQQAEQIDQMRRVLEEHGLAVPRP